MRQHKNKLENYLYLYFIFFFGHLAYKPYLIRVDSVRFSSAGFLANFCTKFSMSVLVEWPTETDMSSCITTPKPHRKWFVSFGFLLVDLICGRGWKKRRRKKRKTNKKNKTKLKTLVINTIIHHKAIIHYNVKKELKKISRLTTWNAILLWDRDRDLWLEP